MDYGSKVFAQVYLGVSYREPLISPESLERPSLFFLALFLVLLFHAFLKIKLLKKAKLIEFSQILIMASVAGNLLDNYLYPGSVKWIFNLNFADLYLIGSLALLLSLIKFRRKAR